MQSRYLIALCALLLPARAFAHAPPQATGIEWSQVGGSERLLVRTNRGLLVREAEGEPVRLLCNDAYRANLSETVPFHATDAGLLLSSFEGGLLRGSADLCEFEATHLALGDQTLIDLGARGQAVFAITLPGETTAGHLYSTVDGGRQFSDLSRRTAFATSLALAPSSDQTLYLAELDLTNPEQSIPRIAVSHDAGRTFDGQALQLEGTEFRSFVLAVDELNEARLFVRTEPGDSTAPERLLLSEDGAKTFTPVLSAVGPLSIAIDAAQHEVWAGGFDGLYHSKDGGKHFEPVASSKLSRIGCLAIHDGALYACGYATEFGVFKSTDGGASFEPFLRFPEVKEPILCPADSPVAKACAGTFEDWAQEQSGVDADDDHDAELGAGGALAVETAGSSGAAGAEEPSGVVLIEAVGCHLCAAPGASRGFGVGSMLALVACLSYLQRTQGRRSRARARMRASGPRSGTRTHLTSRIRSSGSPD